MTPRKRKKQPGFQNAPAQNPPFVPMYFHEMAFRHQKITQSLSSFVHHPFGPAPPPPPPIDDNRASPPSPRTPIYMGRSRSQDAGVYRPPALPPPDDSSPPPSVQPPQLPPQSSSFRFAENGSPWKPSGTFTDCLVRHQRAIVRIRRPAKIRRRAKNNNDKSFSRKNRALSALPFEIITVVFVFDFPVRFDPLLGFKIPTTSYDFKARFYCLSVLVISAFTSLPRTLIVFSLQKRQRVFVSQLTSLLLARAFVDNIVSSSYFE